MHMVESERRSKKKSLVSHSGESKVGAPMGHGEPEGLTETRWKTKKDAEAGPQEGGALL